MEQLFPEKKTTFCFLETFRGNVQLAPFLKFRRFWFNGEELFIQSDGSSQKILTIRCKRSIKKTCKQLTVNTYLKDIFFNNTLKVPMLRPAGDLDKARKYGQTFNNEPIREEYKHTWDEVKPGAVFKSSHSSNNSLQSSKRFYRAHHFYSPSTSLTTERAAAALLELPKPTETSR